MDPLRITDWSKEAFKFALFVSVFLLVVSLIVDGINWLIWRRWFDKDLAWFIPFAFSGTYFTMAVNSVHERLNEIENAVRSNSGKQAY